jgi:hypothetical protein
MLFVVPCCITAATGLTTHLQSDNNNNSIQLFIIYVPSHQLQGQLQTQHSVITDNELETGGKS